MRYIGDDGEVFITEQECSKYEKGIRVERENKFRLELERQNRLNTINKKYKELQKLIANYMKDYEDVSKLQYHDLFTELFGSF